MTFSDGITEDDLDRAKEIAVMALSDGLRSIEEIEQLQKLREENLERHERLLREDAQACSQERVFESADKTQWRYVIVHDVHVRITGCVTQMQELRIPEAIEGLPVVEVDVDSCAYLESVREVICSPQIERIGACAFRGCKNLERLVLPRNVDSFDPSWARGCKKLSDLVLPGMLERVMPDIFNEGDLRVLTLGVATHNFIPGVFSHGHLEEIRIDEDNPFLTTDGLAVYAHAGEHIRTLAVSCDSYAVPHGCKVVEKKAFANWSDLKEVDLPDTIETIEDYGYSYSGIEAFIAPPNLESIGERAFFRCKDLKRVVLNEGLEVIGNDAFTGSGIDGLEVPSTLVELGKDVAASTSVVFSGPDASFSIASGGVLKIDDQGGLYRNMADGKHFVRLYDKKAKRYEVEPGTVGIDPFAFARHACIEEVTLPEGLAKIGDEAFRDCFELAYADLPSTIEEIGKEAFLDTSLARVRIPASLEVMGSSALITHGAHNGDVAPSLLSIEVDPQNQRFYLVDGLLIEHRGGNGDHAVVFSDSASAVHIPEEVVAIDPYAFGGARNLRELYMSDRIKYVGIRGLSIDCFLELIHIDLDEPVEGHSFFEIRFPDTARSKHEIKLAFNLSNRVNLELIFKHYDSAITNMHEFDQFSKTTAEQFDVYGQAKLAISRLADPVFMNSTNKIMLSQTITDNLEEVCEAISRHDDRKAIDDLIELGYLNKDNLLSVIDHISKLQDAAMTGYLLEIKRRMFKRSAMDFDL